MAIDPKSTALVIVDLQGGILTLLMTPHDGGSVVARAVALDELV